MFFNRMPLRNKIMKMIVNNPVPHRNTDILSPNFALSITFFFNRYKSVVVNELYFKGLINLHGDVELFIKAKRSRDTKYLRLAASITPKGLSYYNAYILGEETKETKKPTTPPAIQTQPKRTLTIVR